MELRHLRYFVAVAEELHFTRAAQRLGIKQPPLSAQIRQLETELGATLFRRLTRGVELTPAGKAFLTEARQILDQVARAKNSTARRARGESGQLYVGFAGGTYFHPLMIEMIREFRTKYPDVALIPVQGSTCSLTEDIVHGDVDLALVRSRKEGEPGVLVHPLVEEELLAVLPKRHELASRRSLKLSALADESFVLCPRKLNPTVFDSIVAACERAGFTPRIGPEPSDLVSTIPLVAAGFGVSLVPAALQQVHLDGVVYLPLSGEKLFSPIKLALKRDTPAPAVRNFVQIARRLAAHGGAQPASSQARA